MSKPEVPPPAPGSLPITFEEYGDLMEGSPHHHPPPELDDPASARQFWLVAGTAAGVVAAALTVGAEPWWLRAS